MYNYELANYTNSATHSTHPWTSERLKRGNLTTNCPEQTAQQTSLVGRVADTILVKAAINIGREFGTDLLCVKTFQLPTDYLLRISLS